MVKANEIGNKCFSDDRIIKTITKLFLFTFFLFYASSSFSAIYYVSSSSGNDNSTGTSENSAWRSLAKVNSFTFRAGDQILFKRGDTWTGTITVNTSGTVSNPVTYGAYGSGEKPKIYGSELISGWTRHSGNIYKKELNFNIEQLFINGERLTLARYPKSEYLSTTSVNGTTQFTSTGLNSGMNYRGAKWIGKTNLYTIEHKTITASNGQTLTINSGTIRGLGTGRGFFLADKLEFLTQPGEWHFDSSTRTVYAWMPNSDSPDNYSIRGSVHENGVTISRARHNIIIQDLEFIHHRVNGIYMYDSNNITVRNNSISYCQGMGINTALVGNNLVFTGNNIAEMHESGIFINYGNNYTISENIISNIGLQNNIGRHNSFRQGIGISILGGNATISYNRITNCGYISIYFNKGVCTV